MCLKLAVIKQRIHMYFLPSAFSLLATLLFCVLGQASVTGQKILCMS